MLPIWGVIAMRPTTPLVADLARSHFFIPPRLLSIFSSLNLLLGPKLIDAPPLLPRTKGRLSGEAFRLSDVRMHGQD